MKSPVPPQQSTTLRANPLLAMLDTPQRKVLLAGLIVFFVLAGLTTLLLAYYVFEPEITGFFQTPTPTLTPTATPACVGSTLQLSTKTLHFESIKRATDGSINVPADTPGVAYWIEDLENNTVFALSPTPENLTLLNAIQGGEEAILTWGNCNIETYLLSAPQTGEPSIEMLISEPTSQLVVYIPGSASSPGIWVQGELVGETITSPATYEPAPSEVNAEISLLETTTSPDGTTIQVVVSILNYGAAPITLSAGDISLTPEAATSLGLTQSDPLLPQQINPKESKTFTLVFPLPPSPTAILKIFTIEFDLDNY